MVPLLCALSVGFRSLPVGAQAVVGKGGSPEAKTAGYFRSPLDVPLKLTGTFGELRSNHFHSGLDIATEGVTGLPVYACAEGFVRRINISPWGYGTAVYIQHPNGLTTVYGHLEGLEGALAEYIDGVQRQRQSWALDIDLPPGTVPVEKGQVIARAGNSGGSGGPHLHFEVRRGDTPLNPMAHGFEIEDHRAPEMRHLYVYPIWDEGPATEATRIRLYRKGNTWYPSGGKVVAAGQRIGLGLDAWDRQDARNNRNGIYSAELYVDDALHWSFRFDSLSFAEKRYCNAHADYRSDEYLGAKVHRLFRLPGNRLSLYPDHPSGGLIDGGLVSTRASEAQASMGGKEASSPPLRPAEYAIRIELRDFAGNTSTIAFDLQADPDTKAPAHGKDTLLAWFKEHRIGDADAFAVLPRGSLYENTALNHEPVGQGPYSVVWRIGNDGVALHQPMDLALRAKALPPRLAQSVLIKRLDRKGRSRMLPARWESGWVHARSDRMGRFEVVLDTMPPTISPRGWREGQTIYGPLRFTIGDDRSGVAEWYGTVDGHWQPFAWDPKRALLSWEGLQVLEPGTHTVVLRLEDHNGNAVERSWRFRR